MSEQSIQRHDAPKISLDKSQSPWILFLSFFYKHPFGPWYALISFLLIGGTIYLSYLSNQWVGNFFGYLQSLNAARFYHSVWVLGGLTFGLLLLGCCLDWILGRMRISMNLFYRDMLLKPHDDESSDLHSDFAMRIERYKQASFRLEGPEQKDSIQKNTSSQVGTNLYKMTMQSLYFPELFKRFALVILYGSILYFLLPVAKDSLWGLHTTVPKPIFVFLILYALTIGVCAYFALRYVNQSSNKNIENQNKQGTFLSGLFDPNTGLMISTMNNAEGIQSTNETTASFDTSFFPVLQSWTMYSAVLALVGLSASMLPWLIMGYVYFKGVISLAIMMQASIAIMVFLGYFIDFLNNWRRLSRFPTYLRCWGGRVQRMRKLRSELFRKIKIDATMENNIFKYKEDDKNLLRLKYGYQYQITGEEGQGKSTMMKQMVGVVTSKATLSCSENFDVLYRPQLMNQSMLMRQFNDVKEIKAQLNKVIADVKIAGKLPGKVNEWLNANEQDVEDKQAKSLSPGTRQWLLNLYMLVRVKNWKKKDEKAKKPLLVLMDEPHASTQCGQDNRVDFIAETARALAGQPATLVYTTHAKSNTGHSPQSKQPDSKDSNTDTFIVEERKM